MSPSHVNGVSKKRFFSAKEVTRVPKEWGEEQWIVNKEYCGKKLILKKNRRCSMHSHKKKDEVFYLQSGKVLLEMDDKKYILLPGDFIHVLPNSPHRFTGLLDSEIIEFSTTHDEEDSYRTEFSGHSDPVRFERQSALVKKWKDLSILVIGDVMVDRYVAGKIDRISPEAPVPVVHAASEHNVLGGAANVAANIMALGAGVLLMGVIGKDQDGITLQKIIKKHSIKASLFIDRSRPTIVKQRITSLGGQQVVRLDREATHALSAQVEGSLLKSIDRAIKNADVVLLSDYAKGVISPTLLTHVLESAKKNKIHVVVDPKPHGQLMLRHLKGVSLLTPNVQEAYGLLGDHHASPEVIGKRLSKLLSASLILTRGGEGMDVFEQGRFLRHIDSSAPQVTDVSGAGDTVAAVSALVLAAKGSLTDAAEISNAAASIVVQKRGTATLSSKELLDVL